MPVVVGGSCEVGGSIAHVATACGDIGRCGIGEMSRVFSCREIAVGLSVLAVSCKGICEKVLGNGFVVGRDFSVVYRSGELFGCHAVVAGCKCGFAQLQRNQWNKTAVRGKLRCRGEQHHGLAGFAFRHGAFGQKKHQSLAAFENMLRRICYGLQSLESLCIVFVGQITLGEIFTDSVAVYSRGIFGKEVFEGFHSRSERRGATGEACHGIAVESFATQFIVGGAGIDCPFESHGGSVAFAFGKHDLAGKKQSALGFGAFSV